MLADSHPRAAAVFVDALNAGGFEGALDHLECGSSRAVSPRFELPTVTTPTAACGHGLRNSAVARGTFSAPCSPRKAAIEGIIDADPIAACVRDFMSDRSSWAGSAADLLQASAEQLLGRVIVH